MPAIRRLARHGGFLFISGIIISFAFIWSFLNIESSLLNIRSQHHDALVDEVNEILQAKRQMNATVAEYQGKATKKIETQKKMSLAEYTREARKKNTHNITERPSNCMYFKCIRNKTECDNTMPTNYNGPDPPCCVHILRDVTRVFDEAMHDLSLDYSVAFGTLLGLRRADRLIEWTGDNDYIIPSVDVMMTMKSKWNSTKTGLSLLYQDMDRMCATSNFMNGALQKWEMTHWRCKFNQLYLCGFPYIDFYIGKNTSNGGFSEIWKFQHRYEDFFPTKQTLVYNKTFPQNFPANPDKLLQKYYGRNWRVPLASKSLHGKATERAIQRMQL